MGRQDLRGFLDELKAAGAVSAAAAVIGDSSGIRCEGASGRKSRSGAGRVTTSSLFDLASLTKPVTATLALVLDADATLPLRQTVAKAAARAESSWPLAGGLARCRLESLLRHRSGLQAWTPLFASTRSPEEAVPWLASGADLLGARRPTYSDLGYILWAWLAQRIAQRALPDLVRERLARPLGLAGLGAPPGNVAAAVACSLDNRRERELAAGLGIALRRRGAPERGTAQDGNARFLGPSGHAGLFGSARAVWRLAAEWARPRVLLTPGSVAAALAGSGDWALGWRRRPPETGGRDGIWYGHQGFTGGGVWFCAETGEVRVLLAHRLSVATRMDEWRRRFLELQA